MTASDPHTVLEKPALNCSDCAAQCCRYFALQLDTPSEPEDYDNIRWYLAHKDTAVFVEGEDWYLQVNTICRYLQTDSTCGIYDHRPQICERYGWDAKGDTECHGTDKPCDHDYFFSSPEELEEYLVLHSKK